MWGIIIEGTLYGAPLEFYKEDGTIVSLHTEQDYLDNGFKRVIIFRPAYNTNTQKLKFIGFEETDEDIKVLFEVVEILDIQTIYEDEINKDE